jgi:hypothetical protein
MPFSERVSYHGYRENMEEIERGWDKTFGDRKNEIVFIGQEMDKEKITKELDACLSTDSEIESKRWKVGYPDDWSVPLMN